MTTTFYRKIKTTFGTVKAYANTNQLLAIDLGEELDLKIDFKSQAKNIKSGLNPAIDLFEKQMREYLSGTRTQFDLPLLIEGTPFQKKCWKALTKIPYGKTISYKEQAKSFGNEKAVRAVGSANGKNRFPIIIPCHRVIASDGTLGGYSGGLNVKIKLLKIEQRN